MLPTIQILFGCGCCISQGLRLTFQHSINGSSLDHSDMNPITWSPKTHLFRITDNATHIISSFWTLSSIAQKVPSMDMTMAAPKEISNLRSRPLTPPHITTGGPSPLLVAEVLQTKPPSGDLPDVVGFVPSTPAPITVDKVHFFWLFFVSLSYNIVGCEHGCP